jgi:hypothetical protein
VRTRRPADGGGVSPERVEDRVLVVPIFQTRKGGLVDAATPGHLRQGESRRALVDGEGTKQYWGCHRNVSYGAKLRS